MRCSWRILPGSTPGLRRCPCLRRGEVREHAARERRIDPQHLVRGDDRVASERASEPRHTRVRERSVLGRRDHHPEVGERTVEPRVEQLVGRLDTWPVEGEPMLRLSLMDDRRLVFLDRRPCVAFFTDHRDEQLATASAAARDVERDVSAADRHAFRRRDDPRPSLDAVESVVPHEELVGIATSAACSSPRLHPAGRREPRRCPRSPISILEREADVDQVSVRRS